MPLIVCMICGRRVTVEKRPKKVAALRCSRCGTKATARVIVKVKAWMDTEVEGLDQETARHKVFAQLKWWAKEKGYKPGWAAVKFKELFGTWPNGESHEEPVPVEAGTMRLIRRSAIEYAKRMRALGIAKKVKAPPPEAGSGFMGPDDWEVKL